MDFLDFDSSFKDDGDEFPQPPQLALALPISSNMENIGKRITSFNNMTRNLLKLGNSGTDEANEEGSESQDQDTLARKYAQMSISFLKDEDDSQPQQESDKEKGALRDESANDTPKTAIPREKRVRSSSVVEQTLSTRLSRVLNTTVSDATIRTIFTELELKYVNYDELIDPGLLGSISRKRLLSDIEMDLIRAHSSSIREYQPLIKQLNALSDKVKQLNATHEDIVNRLTSKSDVSNKSTTDIYRLKHEKLVINLKKNILMQFKAKFTLNEYEEFTLLEGEINDDFFAALAKAEKIQDECSILLSIDNPQLGLKIMSQITDTINKAVHRVVQYVNKSLENYYSLNTRLEIFHKCLRYLEGDDREKSTNFNMIIDNFINTRAKQLVDEFYNQISGNGPDLIYGGDVFISQHDPVRFVGDLLAYIHSVVVNEFEVIENIFTEKESSEVTTKILNALSKPLKLKVDQVITSQTKIGTINQIFNLLSLYEIMFSKHLNPEQSELVQALGAMVKSTQDSVTNIIRNKLATIKSSNQTQLDLNLDLQPPNWIMEFFADVLPLLDQPTTTETILSFTKEENANFLHLIINEPIEIFNGHIQENLKTFENKLQILILKTNFLDLMLSKVLPLPLLNDKVLELNETMHELTSQLSQYFLDSMIKDSGLFDYYNLVNMICPLSDDFFEVSVYQPIVENVKFTADRLNQSGMILHEYLPNVMIEVQSALLRLNSPLTASEITSDAFINYTKFYSKLVQIIVEYVPEVDFGWTDEEVATMLGVEKEYLHSILQLEDPVMLQ